MLCSQMHGYPLQQTSGLNGLKGSSIQEQSHGAETGPERHHPDLHIPPCPGSCVGAVLQEN